MKDYHVHYHIDGCAQNDMTFPNIVREATALGLDEITVVKHYSSAMPNGKHDWICWHCINEDQWQQYLKEFSEFHTDEIILHSGVETELCNEAGDINIPESEQAKIDMCNLSVHYMIDLDCCKMDFLLYPNLSLCPAFNNEEGMRLRDKWKEKVASVGPEKMITGLVNGYINCIKRYPKVRLLSHMYDGLYPLRTYLCDVDSLGENKCVELLEPLMKTMADYGVLWELIGSSVTNEKILLRANEMGVRFSATADAHSINSTATWGQIYTHIRAEKLIDRLGLNRGMVDFTSERGVIPL